MEKGNLSLFFLALLVFSTLQFTSAIETKIKVTTYANHDLSIDFLSTSPVNLIKTMKVSSGTGEVSFTYSSTESRFNMNVFVFSGGVKVLNSRFDDNVAGESIHLILFSNNKTIIRDFQEVTQNNTNNTGVTQNQSQNNSSQNNSLNNQSGDPSPGSSILSGNTPYYIGGAILLVIIVFFLIKIVKNKPFAKKDVKVRKLSDIHEEHPENYKRAVEQAERKMQDMQREINRLKNQEKIKQMESRVRQEQEEIKKLRRGY
jgi:hypothetical protein